MKKSLSLSTTLFVAINSVFAVMRWRLIDLSRHQTQFSLVWGIPDTQPALIRFLATRDGSISYTDGCAQEQAHTVHAHRLPCCFSFRKAVETCPEARSRNLRPQFWAFYGACSRYRVTENDAHNHIRRIETRGRLTGVWTTLTTTKTMPTAEL